MPSPDEPIAPRAAVRRLAARYDVDQGDAHGAAAAAAGDRHASDEDLLDGLAALRHARQQLDQLEAHLLRTAHDQRGLSFTALAPALGVSRQAAEMRYRRRVQGARGANLADARAALRQQQEHGRTD